jgi:Diadenosine tetraphosphate (Ap4A) hydrolase and other HIT family hydrolases
MTDCIFCKLIAGEMGTKFVYEDEQVVVFPDIRPKATTHMLITSKKHIPSLNAINESDTKLMGHMVQLLPKIAKQLGINSFRTIINTGKESGQEIDHLHFHLLAGSFN